LPPHIAQQHQKKQAVNGKAPPELDGGVKKHQPASKKPALSQTNSMPSHPPTITTTAGEPAQTTPAPLSSTVKDPTITIFPTSIHTIINVTVDIKHQLLAGCVDLFLKNTTSQDITDLQVHVSDQMRINGAFEVLNEEREILDNAADLSTGKFQNIIHNKATTRETTAYIHSESSESSEVERSLVWAMEIRAKQAVMGDAGALLIKLNKAWKRHDGLRIRIYYEIVRPSSGLYFVNPKPTEDEQEFKMSNGGVSIQGDHTKKKLTGYAYTCGRTGGARLWFPCIDALEAFSSYEIEITTHRDAIVVCSGSLLEQSDNQEMGIRTTKFVHDEHPVPPHLIGFVIGPFSVYIDEELPNITHFFPKKYPVHHIKHTVLYLRKVVAYFSSLTKLPFHELYPTFKVVFLDAPISPLTSFCTLGLVSTDYILDPAVVDGTVQRRVDFSSLISSQYFGNFVLPKYFSDSWLTIGIARFMSLLYLEHVYGPNELRYHLLEQCEVMPKKDDSTIALGDVRNFAQTMHPLLQDKSPLVCYMISQIIGRSNMEAMIETFVSEAFGTFSHRSHQHGEMDDADAHMQDVGRQNGKSTKSSVQQYAFSDPYLTQMEEKITHAYKKRLLYTKSIRNMMITTYRIPKQDVRDFFSYWVNGRGFPQFQCAYTYDPNRSKILFAFKQMYSVDSESSTYAGKIKLEIHEKDFPYSREVRVDSPYFWAELDCSSKPRKNQKKGDSDEVQYEIPIKYIIVNPELSVLCHVNLWQDVSQWMYQLEGAKDLIGQLSAVRGLKYWQSTMMLDALRAILHSNDVYYRIRFAIIDIFAEDTHPRLADSVLTMLRDFFIRKYCDINTNAPLPNDFSSIIEYTMKKKLINAFGSIRDRNGVTPNSIPPLLRSLLQHNDNSRNKFSDTHYLATCLVALTHTNPQSTNIDEVERWNKKYLVLDSLIPSHHSHFSVVTLKNLTDLFCDEKLPLDVSLFEERLRTDLPIQVRETALSCLATIHDTAFKHTYKLDFDKIFLQIITQLIDGVDLPYHKHRICKSLVDGINKCSARLVEAAIREEQSRDTSLERFLKRVRSESLQNRPLVEKLWKQTLSHHDPQLQSDIFSLYLSLWGTQAPPCYRRDRANFVHTVRIDKYQAIFYDPIHPVIEYKEPDFATTSETSVGFKVTRMSIKEGPNAPPFLGTHATHIVPELPPQSVEVHQKSDLPTPKISLLISSFPKDKESKKRKRKDDKSPKKKKKSSKKSAPPLQMIPPSQSATLPPHQQPSGGQRKMPPPLKKPSKKPTHANKTPTTTPAPVLPPNSLESEVANLINYPTSHMLSIQDQFKITSAGATFDKIVQDARATQIQPNVAVPDYSFYCELLLRSSNIDLVPPILIPLGLKECASGRTLFQLLPHAHNEVKTEIDGIAYSPLTQLTIHLPPEAANEPTTDTIRKGEIPYWLAGQSIIVPFSKTHITTPSEYNHRKIKLYDQCLVLGSSYIRLPSCRTAQSVQIMRGRSFGALFRDSETQEKVCQVEAALNHTVAALDFLKRLTPFFISPVTPYNQMLGVAPNTEPSRPYKNQLVIENWKSFFKDQLEYGELAVWERPDDTHQGKRMLSTLLMGTGPSFIPAKTADKIKLIAKCHVVGRFKLGNEFDKLKKAAAHGRKMDVMFYRPYLFIHVGKSTLEMNISDTLVADFMYACLPFGGECQVSHDMIFFRVSGVRQEDISFGSVTEAKAGTLLFWNEKNTFILCTKATKLPGACCEVATLVYGFDVTLDAIRKSEQFSSNKLTIQFVSAAKQMNIGMGQNE